MWKWVVIFVKGKRISYKGYYKVSTFGRVKSVERVVTQKNRWGQIIQIHVSESILKSIPHPSTGYDRICLSKEGKGKLHHLHRIVLETFVGQCPPGMEARHFPDYVKSNNRLSNLSWGTKKQNCMDRSIHGRSNKGRTINSGERNPNRRLDWEKVRKIRRLHDKRAMSQRELAKKYGVAKNHIRYILLNVYWHDPKYKPGRAKCSRV